jgi:hypothetical protein
MTDREQLQRSDHSGRLAVVAMPALETLNCEVVAVLVDDEADGIGPRDREAVVVHTVRNVTEQIDDMERLVVAALAEVQGLGAARQQAFDDPFG